MTLFPTRCMALCLMLLALSTSSLAAQSLTGRDVEGFINAMQELRPLMADAAGQEPADQVLNAPNGPAAADPTDPSWEVRQWLTMATTAPKLQAVLTKHGFDAARFGEVGEKVMQAYTTLKLGPDGLKAMSQLDTSLAQLDKEPSLSAEQKQAIRKQMQEAKQQMGKMLQEAPKADQDAVRPYMAKLDAVFEVE